MAKVLNQSTGYDGSLVITFSNGITLKVKHLNEVYEYYQYENPVGTEQFKKHALNGYTKKKAIELAKSISKEDWENPNYLKNSVVTRCRCDE